MDWAPNGCTVPRALRLLIPRETPEQIAVCNAHDTAYENGGTARQRAIADAKFLLGLLETHMEIDRAERYHTTVRLMGKAHWRGGYPDDGLVRIGPSEFGA